MCEEMRGSKRGSRGAGDETKENLVEGKEEGGVMTRWEEGKEERAVVEYNNIINFKVEVEGADTVTTPANQRA